VRLCRFTETAHYPHLLVPAAQWARKPRHDDPIQARVHLLVRPFRRPPASPSAGRSPAVDALVYEHQLHLTAAADGSMQSRPLSAGRLLRRPGLSHELTGQPRPQQAPLPRQRTNDRSETPLHDRSSQPPNGRARYLRDPPLGLGEISEAIPLYSLWGVIWASAPTMTARPGSSGWWPCIPSLCWRCHPVDAP